MKALSALGSPDDQSASERMGRCCVMRIAMRMKGQERPDEKLQTEKGPMRGCMRTNAIANKEKGIRGSIMSDDQGKAKRQI